MAVYTNLGAEDLAALIGEFDVGALLSAKGIAEGVSNSNWLIDTAGKDGCGARFILTMYEERTEVSDLPYFLGLLDHLSAKGCPVPSTIHDRQGQAFRLREGKALALIEFLPGVSVSNPTVAQAEAVGRALGHIHHAAADFPALRANGMGPQTWQHLLGACGHDGLVSISPDLAEVVEHQLDALIAQWPQNLPRGQIHADLFPDNVLMLGSEVTGLIDFYFACTDMLAYDLAVAHAAWCFDSSGSAFRPDLSASLLSGYEQERPLSAEERAALPLLARGAAMRFLATRAYDWLNTPADALVTRKDPMAFARRLEFYSNPANAGIFA